MGEAASGAPADLLAVGTPVMVRTRYLGSWTGGFVVAAVLEDGYCLRRRSDGAEVPQGFGFSAVRPDPDAV
jgi:hypothetical protein